jgi:hypothetical protein
MNASRLQIGDVSVETVLVLLALGFAAALGAAAPAAPAAGGGADVVVLANDCTEPLWHISGVCLHGPWNGDTEVKVE